MIRPQLVGSTDASQIEQLRSSFISNENGNDTSLERGEGDV